MESFEVQFANHPVHTVIEQLATSLIEFPPDENNVDAINYLDRIGQCVSFARSRLEIASPVLTTAAKLNQVQQPIQACLNEINQYKANKNVGHLANASNQLDAALAQAASIISLEQPSAIITSTDAINFKKLADSTIARLRAKTEESETKVSELEQISDGLAKKLEEQTKQITNITNQVASKLDELQSTFNESQNEKNKSFNSLLESAKKDHNAQLEQIEKSGVNILTSMGEQQKEAGHIVHLIGNIGVTGNFRGAATHEAKLANLFRIIALLCFLGMVTVILYMGFVSLHERFDLWLAIFRFAIGFAFLVPGVYCARESSQHRIVEQKNRRAELELASIDSYLNSLPKEKQDEIKAELSPKYFGGQSNESQEQDGVTGKSLVELLTAAIKGLSSKAT